MFPPHKLSKYIAYSLFLPPPGTAAQHANSRYISTEKIYFFKYHIEMGLTKSTRFFQIYLCKPFPSGKTKRVMLEWIDGSMIHSMLLTNDIFAIYSIQTWIYSESSTFFCFWASCQPIWAELAYREMFRQYLVNTLLSLAYRLDIS